jgi:hypothetical protein
LKSDAEFAASDCEACRMQIENLSDKRAVHPIKILLRAYGLDKEEEDQD